MNRFRIEFLSPAFRNLEKIARFHYKMAGSQSASKITDKLLQTINVLEEQPHAGTEHPDPLLHRQGFRKLVCDDYICIYKLIDETIYIYRIVHGATDYPKSFL